MSTLFAAGRDRFRAQSTQKRERAKILFFLSGKQCAISPTYSRPNFMKFAYNTWICVAMNPFGTKFRQFPGKGSFFSKKAKTSNGDNYLTI